ncbi:MAG: exopolysaccharide Pel transporter PelG [Rhodoferax sp.]|uniref:exopolysaccharide Pel transporter PelG n=1 Tax=Rhodoferax sp. TaxID=50421 RepID=UPI00273775C5|nr:exopolysaccharide Pel transporter PelG [Rhodoferax sp.]MDP2677319.1 exopolysaccharide Pel transporter PelG [Rhodoferax sp.]
MRCPIDSAWGHLLDQRRTVTWLTSTLPMVNIIFTAITLHLGATWFGYSFAMAMLSTGMAGLWVLNRKLEQLEYQTVMLQ